MAYNWHKGIQKRRRKKHLKTNKQTLTKQNNKNPARITSVKREEEERTKQ